MKSRGKRRFGAFEAVMGTQTGRHSLKVGVTWDGQRQGPGGAGPWVTC